MVTATGPYSVYYFCRHTQFGMSETFHKVFVYGTLKRGEPNHHWFSNSKGGHHTFLYNARTKDKYPLVIATAYNIPFLLHRPGLGNQVQGEVYEVDVKVLEDLDVLEEHPDYYIREQYEVERSDTAETEKVWIYMIKTFNKALLKRPFLKSYSSSGPHGLKYVSRYSRDSSNNYKQEIKPYEG
ncbi:putative gamma-glutamylcyclotransferase CG2811 isoform X1 [Euwallacea similis]|uniref:putative gamma-glutamylcyclotransferase CG2811 isoform X1 n=2 Tax=Euwallacea similis TaxID=1736056 RepID=UPI00344D521F